MRSAYENELMNVLKLMAPGTALRDGLENVLKAKTGGLIVIGNQDNIMKIIDGGFYINSDYNPSYLYELAKMDGAIILSSDLKKILYANTQLIPDPTIPTSETGTRHRTADRVARQTGNLVIAISQRRNVITVYKGNIKYSLKDSSIILAKANQAIQTLERYKTVLDESMMNVSALEFENLVSVYDVSTAIQKNEMVLRIALEIDRYIAEMGNEGRLVSMQLEDLTDNVEEDGILMIRDYMVEGKDFNDVVKVLRNMSSEELIDVAVICKLLGYLPDSMMDIIVPSRGYRLLNKIPRLPMSIVENTVRTFCSFGSIMNASIEELDAVDGIGEARAKSIREGIRRLQEQCLFNRRI